MRSGTRWTGLAETVASTTRCESTHQVIIYQASKKQFLHHALREDIEDVVARHFRGATGHGVGPSEVRAWKHSLLEMAKVLGDEEIPEDAGVAIEYQLPQSSKRIDFIITGEDGSAGTKVIIVELKQWSESRRSDKDAIVWARRGGHAGEVEGLHPSYQAWSYAAYLQDFNAAVQDGAMAVQPCAYLHNHPRDGEVDRHLHPLTHQQYVQRLRRVRQRSARQLRHADRRRGPSPQREKRSLPQPGREPGMGADLAVVTRFDS